MTKNEIDKLRDEAVTATRQADERSFVKASTAEVSMYIHCLGSGREMPEAGSEEFWELFDQIESTKMERCSRELMEKYLQRPKREHYSRPSDDPAVRELDRLIEERKRHKQDEAKKISADL